MAGKLFSDATGEAVEKFIKNLGQGKILESNKAVNSLFGAGEYAAKALSSDPAIAKQAFDSTFRHAGKAAGEYGGLNAGKIAGSYIGAAAGYRALSGGGAFRDKNGSANLIGIPFV